MMVGLADAIREKGLAQTQVTDIVRHAGASRRTFYRCFADKDACFIALAEALFELVRGEVEAAVDVTAPWEQQVDQSIDAFVAILTADPVLVSAFQHHLPILGEPGLRIERESLDRYVDMLVRFTSTELMVSAGVGPVSRELATMLMGGFDTVVGRAITNGDPLAELAPEIKDLFKRALRPAG